jgi:hypothetical protein
MIAFAPKGDRVAVAHGPHAIQIRETIDYAELVRLDLPANLSPEALGWSADGARLCVLVTGHRLFYWALTELRHELAKLGLDWAENR